MSRRRWLDWLWDLIQGSQPSTPKPVEPPTQVEPPTPELPYRQKVDLILQHHNRERGARGLAPFTLIDALCDAAVMKADHMAVTGRLDHVGDLKNPNSSLSNRIGRCGYLGWTNIAENIAYGYKPEAVTDAWMDSPPHRRNILNGVLDEIGIAISNNDTYYCAVFGARSGTGRSLETLAEGDVSRISTPVGISAYPIEGALDESDEYLEGVAHAQEYPDNS